MTLLGPVPEDPAAALRWGRAHRDFFLNPTSGCCQLQAKAFAASLEVAEASAAAAADSLKDLAAAEAKARASAEALRALQREAGVEETWFPWELEEPEEGSDGG